MHVKQQLTMLRMRVFRPNENGATLVTALVFLAVLTLLGTTAVVTTITDAKIGGNYKTSVQAFYDAEAGVHYTLASLPSNIASGTLSFTGITPTESYAVTAPAGFAFDPITTFTRVGTTKDYQFQVTGHAGSANSTIAVVFRRATFFPYGLFGDQSVQLNASNPGIHRLFGAYSYDSRVTPAPTALDSTGEAAIGSNGDIDDDATLDADGIDADIDGTVAEFVGIDADPLGASGGKVANAIAAAEFNNNNVMVPAIAANVLDLGSGQSTTLPCGTYYLESITLHPGSTLNIDCTGDPGSNEVKLYLVGGLETQAASFLNFSGEPPNFTLYSNASEPIVFEHFGDLKGTVYAPFAAVTMKHLELASGTPVAHGLIWAQSIAIAPDVLGGAFYFDTALQEKEDFLSTGVTVVSWKEIHG